MFVRTSQRPIITYNHSTMPVGHLTTLQCIIFTPRHPPPASRPPCPWWLNAPDCGHSRAKMDHAPPAPPFRFEGWPTHVVRPDAPHSRPDGGRDGTAVNSCRQRSAVAPVGRKRECRPPLPTGRLTCCERPLRCSTPAANRTDQLGAPSFAALPFCSYLIGSGNDLSDWSWKRSYVGKLLFLRLIFRF